MKNILIILSFFFLGFSSCQDNCVNLEIPACTESVPTDEFCRAVFERWFFDSSTSSCKKIEYGGCNPYGFESKEECETCQCNN